MIRISILIIALLMAGCAGKPAPVIDRVVDQDTNIETAEAGVETESKVETETEKMLADDYEWCKTKAQTVDALATYRDKGLSQEAAFNTLTDGRDLPEHLLETVSSLNSIAFGFSDLQPMAVSTLTYSACMVESLGLLTEDTQGFLIIGAEECQAEFPEQPEEIHQCIDQISANIINASAGS